MRRVILGTLLVATAPAVGQETAPKRFEFTGTEMAAPVRIILYAPGEAVARRAADAALARIRDLDGILSDYDPASELSRLCRSGASADGVAVSADLWQVLARAREISGATGGAFDITVGPAVRLWRRSRRLRCLPDAGRLEEALARVDYRLVSFDPERRSVRLLKAGMLLDLGGIAKGYAADEALETLDRHGVSRALVDVGGDIALGEPPPGESGWSIAVARSPRESGDSPWVHLRDAAVATSGDTEQFVVIEGRRYSHILDPRTGVGLTDRSMVTVVAPDATTADALASAVSVLGPKEGLALVERTPGVSARIVREEGDREVVHESRAWAGRVVPVAATARSEATAAAVDASEGSSRSPTDLTIRPAVAWMIEPVPVPRTRAGTEDEMQAYVEQIPGTDVTFDMVPIRGGRFLMGSPEDEPHRGADEGPRGEVVVEPFWMQKFEVTWEEYELWGLGHDARRRAESAEQPGPHDQLADALTRPTKPYSDMSFGMGRDGYPAICMTQLAAKVYCKWLTAKTGRYYRLPTEAEWEYAARAGTATAYSFGDDPDSLGDYGWYFDNSDDRYHRVGQKKPNPWGLHDMHGNVAEWVLDAYTPGGYPDFDGRPRENPLIVPTAIYPRVVRGGSWLDDADQLRSAARRGSSDDWKMGDPQIPQSIWYHTDASFVGFRVVRPLGVPGEEEAARHDLDAAQKKALADYLEYLAGRQ